MSARNGRVVDTYKIANHALSYELQLEEEPQLQAELSSWTGKSREEIIEHIEVVHHKDLRDELPRLSRLLDEALVRDRETHPELSEMKRLFDGLSSELQSHMRNQEDALFPLIRQLWYVWAEAQASRGGIGNLIQTAKDENDEAWGTMTRLSRLATESLGSQPHADGGYRSLIDGLKQFEAHLHHHLHEENAILFPKVFERFAGRA